MMRPGTGLRPLSLGLTLSLLATALPHHLRAQTVEEIRQRFSWVARGNTLEVGLAAADTARGSRGTTLRGELLAANERTLWLLRQDGVVDSIPLPRVVALRAERHGIGSRRAGIWAAVGGLVTTVGMLVACQSVEDSECGGVIAVVGGSWAVIGGVAALSMDGSRWEPLPMLEASLRPYARFPQGLPPDFRRRP